MRNLTFSVEKQFRYAYESTLFPKFELNEQQERAQAKLLDKFEAVGTAKQLNMSEGGIETRTFAEGQTQISLAVEDAEFRLLKAALAASRPNGLYVRTKLAVLDYLDTVKDAE